MKKTDQLEMKGFLSFLVLWMLSRNKMTGSDITKEIEQRKGTRPSPGTIYPCLKELKKRGLIQSDKEKVYTLTKKGQKELESHLEIFCTIFSDFNQMRECCHGH